MTTDESRAAGPGDMNDEVALLVRLAGTSGLIAAERVARVRTAVYGAWSDEYVARQVTRRRRLTVAVRFAAAASVVIAVAIGVWSARRHQYQSRTSITSRGRPRGRPGHSRPAMP